MDKITNYQKKPTKIINFKGKELSITMANNEQESGPDHEKEASKLLLRCSKCGKDCVDKPWVIDFIGKEASISLANEEQLLKFAKREIIWVDKCPHKTIRMVPSVLRDLSQKSFIPRVVSIGPLHRDNKNLHEFEVVMKASYLRCLLSRSSSQRTPEDQLKECLKKVKAKIEDIRSFYDDGVNKKYKDDAELANMMVLDGSFILEFCLKRDNKEATWLSKRQFPWIVIDLMLLENQIPFIVLQTIFNCTINNRPHQKNYLTCLLRRVLGKFIHPFSIPDKKVTDDPINRIFPDNSEDSEHAHVLDCLHKIYKVKPSKMVGDGQPSEKDEDSQTSWNYNYSVVEMDRSGVIFEPQKKKEDSISMNIEKSRSCFLPPWSSRTLFMPTLVIREFTEAVLKNFIAYEQFFPKEKNFFTSYSFVMDRLINNEADVGTLVESEVLINLLGSHKEVATVIKSICKNIEVEQFYYAEEIQELDSYCSSYWPKHMEYLRRTYFKSPWNYYNLLAGIILFGLTVVQTIFTVKSYYP